MNVCSSSSNFTRGVLGSNRLDLAEHGAVRFRCWDKRHGCLAGREQGDRDGRGDALLAAVEATPVARRHPESVA
eukprot:768622-Hanusia_phi.AAC.5